jgi:hypothetical protein
MEKVDVASSPIFNRRTREPIFSDSSEDDCNFGSCEYYECYNKFPGHYDLNCGSEERFLKHQHGIPKTKHRKTKLNYVRKSIADFSSSEEEYQNYKIYRKIESTLSEELLKLSNEGIIGPRDNEYYEIYNSQFQYELPSSESDNTVLMIMNDILVETVIRWTILVILNNNHTININSFKTYKDATFNWQHIHKRPDKSNILLESNNIETITTSIINYIFQKILPSSEIPKDIKLIVMYINKYLSYIYDDICNAKNGFVLLKSMTLSKWNKYYMKLYAHS